MHDTALENGWLFFDTYVRPLGAVSVLDVGALAVNGSLRSVAPSNAVYIGVDMAPGLGVDIVAADPYTLPFSSQSFDVVVSTSCFEHVEMFWVLFLEILRVTKPNGLVYVNAPSNGGVHRYPVDCWRFYPDAAKALEKWARRNGYQPSVLEQYIGARSRDSWGWEDFVAVWVRDESFGTCHPRRIQGENKP
jgi:SAM-dependent methyltransferase